MPEKLLTDDARCSYSVVAVIDVTVGRSVEVLVTAGEVFVFGHMFEPLTSVGETVFLALSLISEAATSKANSPVGTVVVVLVEVETAVECVR